MAGAVTSPSAAVTGAAGSTATGAGATDMTGSAAMARASAGDQSAQKSSLKVTSYDAKSGRAVVSDGDSKPAGVVVGDVLAGAPSSSAPDGLLVKVTQVLGGTTTGTEVATEPATLRELLGKSKVDETEAVDPSSVTVKALDAEVTVSGKKGSGATFGSKGADVPLGTIRVDVSDSVATASGAPASAKASVKGYVELTPEVEFAYDGTTAGAEGQPASAYIGLSGDWSSQWELDGQASAAQKGTKVPFAELHTDVVIYVGPVPVVVNLGYVLYYQVDADGKVSVRVSQSATGDFTAGGSYNRATGWSPVNKASMAVSPVKSAVTSAGNAKATLGAEASVGLYGAADVTLDIAPYARVAATGGATGTLTAAPGTTPSSTGGVVLAWAVYGGYDVSGTLNVHLTVFSTEMDRSIRLFTLHGEKKLDEGHYEG
ncbi:hypothetical protein ACIPC1_40170 [Streptomyces sp. NPDC087263]|uniref:hypothetical protein n=1 Tax=Streptomyces sp. NPDC087263 TaxID=3365773 RepID=UPI003814AA9F